MRILMESEIKMNNQKIKAFITIIIIFLICEFFPNMAISQSKNKIVLFELNLSSTDTMDFLFRDDLQKKIMEKFDQSQNFEVELVDLVNLEEIKKVGGIDYFLQQMKIRYCIRGKMIAFADQLKVDIVLNDRGSNLDSFEEYTWNESVTKDLLNINNWFEKLSDEIYSQVTGSPLSKMIFTYCFQSSGGEDKRIEKLRIFLPRKLRTLLEAKGFGEKYKLNTLPRGSIEKICGDEINRGFDTRAYHYVIRGNFTSAETADMVEVLVEVNITKKDLDKFIKGFKASKNNPKFEGDLADYIIQNWPQNIGE